MPIPILLEMLEPRCFLSVSPATQDLSPHVTSAAVRAASPSANQSLSVHFDAAGLAKIVYGKSTLFDGQANPEDRFAVADYTLIQSDGTRVTQGGGNPIRTQWNSSTKTLTWTYSWGSIACQYVVSNKRVTMTFSVKNTSSSSTVAGVNVNPLTLRLPNAPSNFSGANNRFPREDPPVVTADYGSGEVAWVDQNVTRNLYIPLIQTGGLNPNPNRITLLLGTTAEPNQPTSWPIFDTPIAPGHSDTYTMSLRFAPGGTPPSSIGSDIYSAFAKAYPMQLNWSDRRSIGQLILASSSARTTTNPRGWIIANDGGGPIDVTTTQGLANFRARMLAFADNAVSILKSMNSQGALIWDIEGQQYDRADYIGDPREATTLAPEWTYLDTIDAFFQKFTAAGLRVGVMTRAQQLAFDSNGPFQQNVPDSQLGQLLSDKMSYAQQHWGATLFYIDSNNYHTDSSIFRSLAATFSNSLLIPEHHNTADYAVMAAYDEARQNVWQTSPDVKAVYSSAFSTIYVADVPVDSTSQAMLSSAVKQGDILLYQGWWNAPENPMVKAAYG